MKKNVRFLFLLAAMLLPFGAKAQLQCNGTQCNVTIEMEDDYGDGWVDGDEIPFYIRVYQGTTLRGSATLSDGTSGQQTIAVCSDEAVRFEFYGNDYYSESSFSIILADGSAVISNAACGNYSSGQTITTVANACSACSAPANFVVDVISPDDVTLSWSSNTGSYELIVLPATADFDSSLATTTSDTVVSVDTLTANTVYNAWVRSDCGSDGYSTWIGPLTFAPGSYNMTNGTDTLRGCDYIIYDNGGVAGNYSNNQNTTLILYPDEGQMLVLTGTSFTESHWDILRIYSGTGAGRQLVFTDSASTTTRFDIGPLYIEGGATVVFTSDGSNTEEGFQINVGCMDAPNCGAPHDLSLLYAGSDTLQLSWLDTVNSSASYMVEYRPADSAEWESVAVSDTTVILDELNSNTLYEVRVRAICSSTDSSYAITGTYRTACSTISNLPWTENFDSYTWAASSASSASSISNLPCWDFNGLYSYYSYLTNSSYYVHGTGGNAIRYYASSATSYPSYMVLPPFEEELSTLMFTFWMNSSNSASYVGVGFMTDPTDQSTYTEVAEVRATATDTYEFKDVVFPDSASGRIAMRYYGSYTSIYLDDFTVMEAPDCIRPTSLTVSGVTGNEATFSIADDTPADSYQLVIFSGSDTVLNTTIYDTTFTIDTLSPSTNYTVMVSKYCDDGSVTAAVTAAFRTECVVLTMPWTEDFDTWTTKSDCWTFLSGAYNNGQGRSMATTSTSAWTLNNSYGSLAISGKALTMNVYSTYRYWAVTPMVAITDDNAMLSVDVAASGWSSTTPNYDANDTLAFAISTDGGTTFTNLLVLDNTQLNALTTAYTTIMVPVTGYDGQNVKFAIFAGSTSSGGDNRIAIDNVNIAVAASCLPPYQVSVNGVTATEATVVVNDTAHVGNYQLVILSGTDTVVNTAISDSTFTIDTLQPSTAYTVQVSSICDDESFTRPTSTTFRTECVAIDSLPYVQDFELSTTGSSAMFDYCWSKGNSNNGNYPYATTINGSKVLYFYAYSPAYCYAVMPVLDESIDINTLMLSFDQSAAYSDYSAHLVVALIDGNTIDANTQIDTVAILDAPDVNWVNQEVLLTAYQGTNRRIAFIASPGGSSSYNYIYLDNITLDVAPDCTRPAAIAVENVGSNEATVTFNDPQHTGSYHLEIAGGTNGTVSADITDTFYTATNLQPNTLYTVSVSTVCASGDTTNAISTTFTTHCADIDVPFTYDFEQYSTLQAVDCWTVSASSFYTSSDYTTYPVPAAWNYSEYAHNSDKSLFFYPTSTASNVIATPKVNHAANDLHVMFWTKGYMYSTTGILEAGVMTDPTDTSTFVALLTLDTVSTDDIREYEFSTNSLTAGTPVSIAFRATTTGSYAYLTIDDVTIEAIPSCDRPGEITVSNITTTTADISWEASSTTNGYEVAYVNGTDTTHVTGTVSGTTYALTGLTSGTAYTVLVRTVCTNGGNSGWRSTNFSTECDAVTSFPYAESFENGLGCWTALDPDNGNNGWRTGNVSNVTAQDGSGYVASFSWSNNPIQADEWLISPRFVLPTADTVTLSWWFKVNASYYEDNYGVLVSNTTADTASFTSLLEVTPTAANGDWTLQTLDLTAYAGQSIYIAFHHHDSYDMNYILLDNLHLTLANAGAQPTTYSVSAVSADNTMGTASVTPSGTVVEGTSVTFTATPAANHTFTGWLDATGDTVSTANPYTVTVNADITLTATFVYDGVGIDGVEAMPVVLAPNPATSTVTLSGIGGKATVAVIDMNGRQVYTAETEGNTTIDVSTMAKGTYFVRIVGEQAVAVRKLVVR